MYHLGRFVLSSVSMLGVVAFFGFGLPSVSLAEDALEVLEANGLTPETDSIRNYLNSLHPDSETTKHIRKLIAQLGDEDFFRRESAMRELVRTPIHSPTLLEEASKSEDREIAWRAKQVLKLASGRTDRLLYAVFSVIESEELEGLTDAIIQAFPYCDDEYLKLRAGEAIAQTSTKDDLDILVATALAKDEKQPPEPALRVAAIKAMEALGGEESDETLRVLIANEQPDVVRLAASRAMANHGNRRSLPTLVGLLESRDAKVRSQSVRVLRALTHQKYDYMAYDDPDDRSIKALAWKRWLEDDSPDAKLFYPLKDITITFGRTLFANYSRKTVYELDSSGEKIWEQSLSGVWAVRGLPNGNRLIASYTSKFLVEYDSRGKEVWRYDNLPNKPYSVQRLPNGNTLVPIYGSRLLEIRPDKTFAREIRLPETVKWAEQLENGRILVVFYNSGRIAELDKTGRILWEVGGMGQPYSVQRLENGNTLVANRRNNKVLEVDRQGKVVWSYNARPSLYRAQRLPGGNTLIVTSTGALEVNTAGETVWKRSESGLRGIDRY